MTLGIFGAKERGSHYDRKLLEKIFLEKCPDKIVTGLPSESNFIKRAIEIADELGIPVETFKPKIPAAGSINRNIIGYRKRAKMISDNCDILIVGTNITRSGGAEMVVRVFLESRDIKDLMRV